MGTISCHSNQSSYLTGIKNITFRSPIPIAAIYVENGKNLPHASEEMSFENVDNGRKADACIYYKLTIYGLGELKRTSYKKNMLWNFNYS